MLAEHIFYYMDYIRKTYGPIMDNNTYRVDSGGNEIHRTAIIYPGVILGRNNYIGPYCVIGAPAEKKGHEAAPHGVFIGDNNRLTGHVTIDAGTRYPTRIGNGCYLMKRAHVGHDAIVQDNVTLSVGVIVGGWTLVMYGANMGLGSVVHPRHIVGAYAMVGMGAIIPRTKPVVPFAKLIGPGKYIGRNEVAIQREKISPAEIEAWEIEYNEKRYSHAEYAEKK